MEQAKGKFTFGDWWGSMTTPVDAYEPQKVEKSDNKVLLILVVFGGLIVLGTLAFLVKRV